jgi:hypothetical protein
MALTGFSPSAFYRAWDAGLLTCADLRQRVERHLGDRTQMHRDASRRDALGAAD